MNRRLVLNLLGKVLMVEGAAMIPSLLIAVWYGEGDIDALLMSTAITLLCGVVLNRIIVTNENLRAREGFATVAISWIALSLFGGLPFFFDGRISFIDSFFESASGFTTTGSTILTNVEALPKGLLFWRSFTHWIGGMGVLVLSMAVIPKMGARALHLLRAESTGLNPGKLVPRLGNTTRILYLIYLGLSILMFVMLLFCGMDWYDSLIHVFGTAGTGGFSNYNASVGHFQSPVIDFIIATFLLLFGVNFSLYFYLINKNLKDIWDNEEFRWYIIIVAASVAIIAINIFPAYGRVGQALRYGYFQVASIITTAGYVTADFNLWPQISRVVLVLLMFIGCSAGSTGGGIKVIRVLLLGKTINREVHRTIHPRGVTVVKLQGKAVEEGVLSQVATFFFTYMFAIVIGVLVVSLDNFDFESTFTAVLACISNIGPGLGMVGPIGNFSEFSGFSKIVLAMLMIVGRLEIYPVLMLLSRATWKAT